MAKYSAQLWEIVQGGVNLFDFDYPIHDENHREDLQNLIIDTYYFREIGFETVGRFKHHLKVKMREIMPIYNVLYRALAESNISVLSNRKTTFNDTMHTVNDGSDGTTALNAETPQGAMDITTGNIVSNINKNSGTTHSAGDTTHTGTITVYDGITEAELFEKYEQHMVDIDAKIVEQLDKLFMQIY